MKAKILFVLVCLFFTFPVYAGQWKGNTQWPAVTGSDADAAINVLCNVNAPATTKQGQAPPGSTSLTFNFTANPGDKLNCLTQLERVVNGKVFPGAPGDEVATEIPFLNPGKGPDLTVDIEPL